MRRLAWAALGGLALALPALAQGPDSSWTTFPPKGDAAAPPLVRRGQEVFEARCHLCHGPEPRDAGPGFGARKAGTEALALKYQGKLPALLEERTDLTADMIRTWVRQGGGIMPFFRKTELSDADLDALAAYLTRKAR